MPHPSHPPRTPVSIPQVLGVLFLGLPAAGLALLAQAPPSIAIVDPSEPLVQRRTIPRVTRPPKLEDFITGNPREAELVITDLRQYSPVAGAPVSTPTTVYLSYDQQNLYAAFVIKDDPALVRAHLTKRDKMDADDRVAIALDTFNDHHRSFWFDANPYGCQQDGMTIDALDDYNWDAVYHSEGRLTADGYVVLIAVPFKSLRFPNKPVQEWSFNVFRAIMRTNEITSWPYISPDKVGWVSQFARLDGIEGVSQGRNVQFVPYAMYSDAKYLSEPPEGVPAFARNREARLGLDAKLIIQDALTLDATVRPDFSQVESDAPQVTTNQRYEVIYPEKRPFFMENANLFQTPTQLFFSRRIVDPRGGAKLSGRLGSWGIGVLAADDRSPLEEEGQSGAASPVEDHRAGIGVARVFREFGPDNRAGMLVTSRKLGQGFNRVVAADARFRIYANWIGTVQWMKSQTRRLDRQSQDGDPGGERFEGSAGMAQVAWSDRHLSYSLLHEDRSPTFRADLGYLDRVDIRRTIQSTSYTWRPDEGSLLSYGPSLYGSYVENRAGLRQNWDIEPGFDLEFARQTRFHVHHWEGFERYRGQEFRCRANQISVSSDFFPWLGASALYDWGSVPNYYPAPGLAPFKGDGRYMKAGLTLKPGIHLSVENSLIYTQLQTSGESGVFFLPTGTNVFIDRILRSNWNYQFTKELSLRAILDYHSLDPDARLVDPRIQKEKRLRVDFLLTYFLHPGTAVYLGYSNLKRNLDFDPTRSPALLRTEALDLSSERLVYLKVSYLIRP